MGSPSTQKAQNAQNHADREAENDPADEVARDGEHRWNDKSEPAAQGPQRALDPPNGPL